MTTFSCHLWSIILIHYINSEQSNTLLIADSLTFEQNEEDFHMHTIVFDSKVNQTKSQ